MRKLFLVLLTVIVSVSSYAQKRSQNDINSINFVKFYNADKPDSIYAFLSAEGRAKAPVSTITNAIAQLKSALGKIVREEYFQPISDGGDVYVAVFEKSGPVLYISFNADHKLTGFYTDVDKRELPGSVKIKATDAELKGTLTVPAATHKVPVVLIIAGSGPTDRDGNSASMGLQTNSYAMLSAAFKKDNIASLRYDKRGVGQSTTTKTQAQITFNDMVNDVVACIRFLKADKRFSKIIIAGHSEGALIALVASEREKVDGVISLAGAGFTGDDILKGQLKVNANDNYYKKAVPIIDSIKRGLPVKQKLDAGFGNLFDPALQPYMHSWFQYNPQREIAKVNVPVLIVQGTTDIQVSIADAQALKKAKPDAQLKVITGMSHILKAGPADRQQNATTYLRADLPLHPEVVPVLVAFIKNIK